jgi:hypothetical protein
MIFFSYPQQNSPAHLTPVDSPLLSEVKKLEEKWAESQCKSKLIAL